MTSYRKIQLSFIIIIVMLFGYGTYSIYKMSKLSEVTLNIFNHPLAVSKATLDSNVKINHISNIFLHEVTLSHLKKNTSLTRIQNIEQKIIKNQLLIQHNFQILNSKYLGNPKDVKNLKVSETLYFNHLQLTLNKLLFQGNIVDIKQDIDKHEVLRKHYIETSKIIIAFADKKADQFLKEAHKEEYVKEIFALIVLLITAIFLSIYIVRALSKADQKTAIQQHLINQNIISCEVLPNGKCISSSNALAAAFKLPKKELQNMATDFFVADKNELTLQLELAEPFTKQIQRQVADQNKWFLMRVTPVFDNKFTIISYQLFFNDISDEKRIEQVSITDTLTGLYNRNYFEMIFGKELKKAKRENKNVYTILLDIDFFKQYNDTYGHLQGDIALKSVSNAIKHNTQRSYDVAFRVGGEEFLIIFDSKDDQHAKAFSEKLIADVEKLHIEHKGSKVNKFLTISIGVCSFSPTHLFDVNEAFNHVDQQLYKAKNEGRNRACFNNID